MGKGVCYEIVTFRSARCAVTWWPTRLPCETAKDESDNFLDLAIKRYHRKSYREKIGQVLYLRIDVPIDLIGLYAKLWKLFTSLHKDGKLDKVYIMLDFEDEFLEFYQDRLLFRVYDNGRVYKWDLAGNRNCICLYLNIVEIMSKLDSLPKSIKNIALGDSYV